MKIIAAMMHIIPRIAGTVMDSFQNAVPHRKGISKDIDTSTLVKAIGPQERALKPVYRLTASTIP
jgi:hypothetical protein